MTHALLEVVRADPGGCGSRQAEVIRSVRLVQANDEALADQPVSDVRLMPRGTGKAEITGEVIVELAQDEGLDTILDALHFISPRVFVSCAKPPASPAASPVS